MLFILTGDIRSGKTRWLSRLVEELGEAGVVCYGALAPGIWERHTESGEPSYEKLGIENILLPQNERIPFATRIDRVPGPDAYAQAGQSKAAKLGWVIPDATIRQVNNHFQDIKAKAQHKRTVPLCCANGFLVVDELGKLEIEKGQGIDVAVSLLEAGPTPLYQHALIVVRDALLEGAIKRFAGAWPEMREVYPTPDCAALILEALLG